MAPLELASPEAAVVEQVDRGTGQLLREQGRNARVDVDEAAGPGHVFEGNPVSEGITRRGGT